MAERPVRYMIEGSEEKWLVFRTEETDDVLRGSRRGTLCLLVPDRPDQHPLDAVSMFLDDPRLSMEPRKTAHTWAAGVDAFVDLEVQGETPNQRVKVQVTVAAERDSRDSVSTAVFFVPVVSA